MTYRRDIYDRFLGALSHAKDSMVPDWMVGWSYQEKYQTPNSWDSTYQTYSGPEELAQWMAWGSAPLPNYIDQSLLSPLIARSRQIDSRITESYGIPFDFRTYDVSIGLNNAQDYFLANAYPMPGPVSARRVLDFGAGYGRQANLWSQLEDDGFVYIAVDGIPKSYCLQHFYLSNLDRPNFDYVIEPSSVLINEKSRGLYHIPTWRLDLVPDGYLDRILAIQVLAELSESLIHYLMEQFRRMLKPTGALYIRDHKSYWQPVHRIDIDQYLTDHGFVKEFEPHVVDKADIHGIPRIFKKINPAVTSHRH